MKKLILAAGLLSLSSAAFSAQLSATCEDYFKQVDGYMELLAKNDAMKGQIETMKQQYDDSKKQFMELPADAQDAACKQGIDALAQAKAMMEQQMPK
ncbi:DUF5339 domain-containing protein [Morganella morganii]|uniref:DUF5339 domain-containing protein n=1 Tax=Morganella morganii TaxID=582 RepID=UPI0034D4B34F